MPVLPAITDTDVDRMVEDIQFTRKPNFDSIDTAYFSKRFYDLISGGIQVNKTWKQ